MWEGGGLLPLSWQPVQGSLQLLPIGGWGVLSPTLDARGLAVGSWWDLGLRL